MGVRELGWRGGSHRSVNGPFIVPMRLSSKLPYEDWTAFAQSSITVLPLLRLKTEFLVIENNSILYPRFQDFH